jgi:paraquat-inducible protein B
MTQPRRDESNDEGALPKPIIRRRRAPLLVIWLVPLIAAVAAGYYLRDKLAESGPRITIRFKDATGLKVGQTPVVYRGVPIGKVSNVQLSDDQRRVLVQVRLRRSAGSFARRGAVYWAVRPEISGTTVTGLDVIFSGPYLEATPGSGESAKEFDGLDREPLGSGEGLRIILRAPRVSSLQVGSPVHFRGILVGVIEEVRLTPDASGVDLVAFVQHRYIPLVTLNSKFWVVSGAEVRGGILTGIRIKLESLRSLLWGGVAFATPTVNAGAPARDGDRFELHDEPKKEWLAWSTLIPLPPEEPD